MSKLFTLIRVITYLVLITNQILGFAKGPLVIVLAIAAVIFLCYDAYDIISTYRQNRENEKKQDS